MQLTSILGATSFDRTRLRRKVLIGLQRSLYFSGVTGLYERFTDRGGFLALMYHSELDSARTPFIAPNAYWRACVPARFAPASTGAYYLPRASGALASTRQG